MHFGKTSVRLIQVVVIAIFVGSLWGLVSAGPPADKKPGLHIKQASAVNFRSSSYHIMMDSSGGKWDIQTYGSVYRGTSYSYSGGMYLQINGTNFQSLNSQGWKNSEGELELGPWNRNNLVIYRRIKAYKKFPLARWLDIIENPTSATIKVPIAIYTNVRYSVSQSKTSSGGKTFGAKDWALWTKGSSSRSTPSLHVITSPDAKIRPTVTVSSSQIYARYNLTIPAGKTVVLCHFESQNRDTSKLEALMKNFPRKELLKDLPASVRSLIVNVKAGGSIAGVELERHAKSDRVLLASGDLMLGTIGNKTFKVSTLLGDMELPADKLLGMVSGKGGKLRFVMNNGQVIGGNVKDVKLNLELPSGGELTIPLEKVKAWSYRISKEKPDNLGTPGPYVSLDSGDLLRLKTDDKAMKLRFISLCGPIDLASNELLEITRNSRKGENGKKGAHVISFVNGSEISGDFEAEKLQLPLTLGGKNVDIPREKVDLIFFSEDDKPDPLATVLRLENADRLVGSLSDKGYRLVTDFGQVDIALNKLRKISFKKIKPDAPNIVTIEMLNGTILRGALDKNKIGFKIGTGIHLSVPTSKIQSMVCPEPEEKEALGDKPPRIIPPPIPVLGPAIRILNGPRR